uniref:Annexin n=1 Tax=Strigamia maritima TaxID=126957 RepID=T1IXL1_STRMM
MANEDATVTDYEDFDAEHDSEVLRKAMKGFGTDEQAIIDVLAYRSNDQRLEIVKTYKTMFGKDLVDNLKSELTGKFEDVIVAVMTPHYEFLAKEVHKAMKGLGTDEVTLVEVIVPLYFSDPISLLKQSYEKLYKKSLEDAITSECSGHFRRLLVSVLQGLRDPTEQVDEDLVHSDVQELHEAGEGQWGTDESVFNKILLNRNYAHLRRVFDVYEQEFSRSMETVIEKEMSGDLQMAFLAVVKSIQNPPAYFAERLYKSMKGMGTDDKTLIRIVVTRSEIDMKSIKEEFVSKYGRTLQHFIAGDCKMATVVPFDEFDPEQDAETLRAAMKGFGTDEKAIIDILARRTNYQRQEISLTYKSSFGKDLINDLKSELTGNFEDAVLAVMTPKIEFLAKEIKDAVSGLGTDEETLIEILVPSANYETQELQNEYEEKYGKSLEDAVIGETSGHFRRLLISLLCSNRDESCVAAMDEVADDARLLVDAGENSWGTDESAFNKILVTRNFNHLNAVFNEYEKLTDRTIEESIESETSGDLQMGYLSIVKCVRNTASFFAERLYRSMKGMGTDDKTLIRIVVIRCEEDMIEIKREFEAAYGKTLDDFISDDVSGDYKRFLLTLIQE